MKNRRFISSIVNIKTVIMIFLTIILFSCTSTENKILKTAAKYEGKKYVFGQFDCSRYTQVVYSGAGLFLPRSARDQYLYVEQTAENINEYSLLIFFDTGWTIKVPNHVGISVSDTAFWHNSSSAGVRKSRINEYWKNRRYNKNNAVTLLKRNAFKILQETGVLDE